MAIVALLVLWVLVGALVAARAVRRGHNPVLWFALSFYGPLLLLLASSAREREREAPTRELLAEGEPGRGTVDVVVGIDGSPESVAAVDHVLELLGDAIGSLTLAAVIDYDVATYADAPKGPERAARQHLAEASARVREQWGRDATTVLLTGAPAEALAGAATEGGAALLVVGSRGSGAGRHLLGSVARQLAERGAPPVLVVGRNLDSRP